MDSLKKLMAGRLAAPKPNRHLHSAEHLLADEIIKAFGEPKKFGMYLGIIKRVGVDNARRFFREVLENPGDDPRKLFMWKCRKPTPPAPQKKD